MNDFDRTQLDILRAEMQAGFNKIVGKLDVQTSKIEELDKKDADKEERLRGVEKWKNALPIGTLLLIVTTAGAIITAIAK